ncbi:hypothetical protein TRVA0_026S00892 [Trichomonascus vanleenenianus]|uniref:uncharacterized protein n=1 Tax=Trichomonascus vanleenenianus TaxID=2268995 RepID=UPI003ECB3E27
MASHPDYYSSDLTTPASGDQSDRGSNGAIGTGSVDSNKVGQLESDSAADFGRICSKWDFGSLSQAVETIVTDREIEQEETDLSETFGSACKKDSASGQVNISLSNLAELCPKIYSECHSEVTLEGFKDGVRSFVQWCAGNNFSTVVTPKKVLAYTCKQCVHFPSDRNRIISILMQLCRWQYRNQLSPYEPISEADLADLVQKIITRPKSARKTMKLNQSQVTSVLPLGADTDIVFPGSNEGIAVERCTPITTAAMVESLLNHSRSELVLSGRLELLLDFATLIPLGTQGKLLMADISLVEDITSSDPTPVHKLCLNYHADGASYIARHVDPRLCAVGAITMYLYERFDCKGDLPNFSSNEWMSAPLFKGMTTGLREFLVAQEPRKQKMPNQPQLDLKLGQLLDYTASESIPNLAVRYLSGFEGQQCRPGMYVIPRAVEAPPKALMTRVFPFIESLEKTATKQAGDFLKLLKFLRVVLLQDTAVFRSRYPHLPIFKQPIFCSPEYELYSSTVLKNHARAHPSFIPQEVVQNIPGMFHAIKSLENQVAVLISQINRIDAERKREIQVLQQEFVRQNERYFRLSNDLNVLKSGTTLAATLQGASEDVLQSPPSLPSQPNATRSDNSNSGLFRSHPRFTLAKSGATPFPQFRLPVLDPWADYDFTRYEMERNTTTVNDLWEEWNHGIGGKPSVKYMDRRFGARWRKDCTKYYLRHKTIVEEVLKTVSALKIPEEEAVNKVENYRIIHGRFGDGALTLNQLQKHIIDARKAGRLLYETVPSVHMPLVKNEQS